MTIVETIETIKAISDSIPGLAASLVGTASILAAFLPKSDSRWRKYLDRVGFNVKNARNAQ